MGVTGDLLNRIIKTVGRKVDLSVYKDGIVDYPKNTPKRQRTSRRPLRIGLDVGTLIARAAHGLGGMLLDERHLTNYGRSLLTAEAVANEGGEIVNIQQQMTDDENRRVYVDGCTAYVMKRIRVLRKESGGEVLVVFDGDTPPIKERECQERSLKRKAAAQQRDTAPDEFTKKRVRAARRAGAGRNYGDIVQQVMQALRLEKIPFMVAPYEADGQLAYLAENDMIDVVVTEDSDLIAHGCRSILYKTSEALGDGHASGVLVQRGDLAAMGLTPKSLSLVDFSNVMLSVMFVALGCDYCSSLKQIGSVAAHDIVRDAFHAPKRLDEEQKQPALGKVFEMLYEKTTQPNLTDDFKRDYEENFLAALLMYRHPMIYSPFLGKCLLMRNPPHGSDVELMDYKPYRDLVSDAKRREELLGTCHGPIISTRIAEGWVNPRTERPYEDMEVPTPLAEQPPTNDAQADEAATQDLPSTQQGPETQDMTFVESQAYTDAHGSETKGMDLVDTDGPETQEMNHVESQAIGPPTPTQGEPSPTAEEEPLGTQEILQPLKARMSPQQQLRLQRQQHGTVSWPSSQSSNIESPESAGGDPNVITLSFTSPVIGLGLDIMKGEGRPGIVIGKILHEKLSSLLQVGDEIVAINGTSLAGSSLAHVVDRFKTLPRPIMVAFARQDKPNDTLAIDDDDDDNTNVIERMRAAAMSPPKLNRTTQSDITSLPAILSPKKGPTAGNIRTYSVVFESVQLGVALVGGTKGRPIVVENVTNATFQKIIQAGDKLLAINDDPRHVSDCSVKDIVQRVRALPRPIRLTFSREKPADHDFVVIDNDQDSDDVVEEGKAPDAAVDLTPTTPTRKATQTSSSTASRLASQRSQGSQISADVLSPDLLEGLPEM